MGRLSRIPILLGVLLLGVGVLFAGSVAAEESTLEEMDGNGTEADPYVITDVEELQVISEDFDAHYVLGNDIDASETARWNAGSGFEPIGEDGNPSFTGTFDGQGHTISGLTIDRPARRNVALFGHASGTIENVRLEDVSVRGGDRRVAGLVGRTTGVVSNVSVTGTVEGTDWTVAGVAAYVDDGGRVERAQADVDVAGGRNAGGLVGTVGDGTVTESGATGTVHIKPNGHGGGLVGMVGDGEVRQSYSASDITGDDARRAGGVAGATGGTISDVFATGEIEVPDHEAGGVVGRIKNGGRAVNAYWDVETTGQDTGAESDEDVGTGLRTEAMTGPNAEDEMVVLDFDHFWTLTDEYPVPESQVEDATLSLDDASVLEGRQTDATVTLTLNDGSTVTASTVAAYDTGDLATVDDGVVDTHRHGTTEITATIAGHTDTAELEIREPPEIELEDAALEAPAVVNGTESEATATYANDGGRGGYTAELIVDGESVATERIWLGADDETTVTFEWTPDGDAGIEHDVAVDETDIGTLTVVDAETVSLESLSAPEQIASGEPYEVTAELGTDSDEPVRATVTYELGAEHSATAPVVIEPAGTTATFDHAHDAAPRVSLPHTVALEKETLEATSEVAEPATFELTDVEAPDEVPVDEAFELTVTVENTGELEGTQSIAVESADGELATEELTVGANATATASATVTEPAAGDYEYAISSDDDERTVSVAITADDDGSESSGTGNGDGEDSEGENSDDESSDGESSDDADDGSDGLPGFGPVTALVALSLVALLTRRRGLR